MKLVAPIAGLLLVACSGSPAEPAAPAASSPSTPSSAAPGPSRDGATSASASAPSPASAALQAKLDGRDAGYKSILAKAYGKNELRLAFSSAALDCSSSPRGYEADVILNHVVMADGTRQWIARQASYVNGIKSADYGAATVTGDPAGTMTVVLPKIAIDSSKEPKLFELSGTVVAKGCGDVAKNPAAPRPQPSVKLRFGGMDLPVVGAILKRGASGDELALSTQPLDCSGMLVEGEDLQVRIQLGKGEAYVGVRGALRGTNSSITMHKKETLPSLKVGAVKGGAVRVDVGLDVQSGAALELAGTVDALVCRDD